MRLLFIALYLIGGRAVIAETAQELFDAGTAALQAGAPLQAVEPWAKLVQGYKNHRDAQTVMQEVLPRLTALQIQENHFQEGLEACDQTLQKFPNTPHRAELLRLRCVALLGLGKVTPAEKAIEFWSKEFSPAPTQLLPLQGRLRLLQNRFAEAATLFQQWRETGTPGAPLLEFQARLQARDFEGAERVPLPDSPESRSLQLQLAQSFAQSGKTRSALRLWHSLRAHPELETVKSGLLDLQIARAFLELHRPYEAALLLKDFSVRFPGSPHSATPLRAHALLASDRPEQALEVIRKTAKRDPLLDRLELETLLKLKEVEGIITLTRTRLKENPPDAAYYRFLLGQTLAQQGSSEEALTVLRECLSGKNPYQEAAAFWIAMTLFLDRRYPEAETAFADYTKRFPNGASIQEVRFRLAQIPTYQKNYPLAISRLQTFLSNATVHQADAQLLLGDSHFSLAQLDAGLAAYRKIPISAGPVYDQAQFQIGSALRQRKEWEALRNHFAHLAEARPESPRLAEMLHQAARAETESGHADRAIELYNRILKRHGNDPRQRNFEEILIAAAKRSSEPRADLFKRWETETKIAVKNRESLRALRWTWARAELLRKSDPASAQTLLLSLKPDPETAPPRILAAIGDAFREAGDLRQSRRTYEALLRWNPNAIEKERAYAGLGLLCEAEGNSRTALKWFSQWESSFIPSPMEPEIRKSQLRLFASQRQWKSVVACGEKLLKCRGVSGAVRAETLAAIGDAYRELRQPDLAIPYYQRLYVMYGSWPDPVARAYWGSGQSFEELGKTDAARKTYKELLARDDLKSRNEYQQARTRLAAMEVQ